MGDKICNWVLAQFPVLCRWVGGMEEWQLIGFTVLIFSLGYALSVAIYNAYLTVIDAQINEDYEDFNPGWMDVELWEVNR